MGKLIKTIILVIFVAASHGIALDLPDKPDSWVHDQAGALSANEKQNLIMNLDQLQKRSSNQIFIAIFDQMPENTYLEDFSTRLYDKWKPGLKEEDNGLLIVIFIQDKKIRIETGYGVEDVITDAQSGTVIREIMAPRFRQNDYYGGIKAALDVLIPAMEGKYKIPVKEEKGSGTSEKGIGGLIFLIVVIIMISKFFGGGSTGIGTRGRSSMAPFIIGSILGASGSRGGGFSSGGGGGGFSGGFGGMSGGGGASGGW
ncbi:MAG: TPM domain-containing protein [Calditrichaceae bacterium]|nr:TPM domain-containing protein [Calditrichaceae bacterium]MBN2707428.1 TPM domain-containing protein [Calditrichaceae bacterium]